MYIVYNSSVTKNMQYLVFELQDRSLYINLHMHVSSNITNIKNYRKTKAQLR